MTLIAGTVFLADCPARAAIEILSDKWAAVTLFALQDGPKRHGALVELIGGISRKVLTQTLRRLQANGLIERHVYAEAPPRVEYELTPLGHTLDEPIRMLTHWAREHGEAVLNYRENIRDANEDRQSGGDFLTVDDPATP
ncbi:helix-turn-helix domain-containing protein [Frondihabitans sp. VKM Ac-2883]|uniref:winged helix-turn-helix transcriptional regulator n=1 Tax=Frondihabitans sp. VKM Ac-2883 TaxID=2783823 RepID=UPI00188A81E9|nr:helix-turn-helix transcriptional regulator [Frondihabitans sp. VKM Ac-2883]